MNRYAWLRGYPPGFIARTLTDGIAGGDADAVTLADQVKARAKRSRNAAAVARELRAHYSHAAVSGSWDSAIGADVQAPALRTIAGFLSPAVLSAARVIRDASRGDKGAQRVIGKALDDMRNGAPGAGARLAMLNAGKRVYAATSAMGADPMPTLKLSPLTPKAEALLERAQAGDADAARRVAAIVKLANTGDTKAATALAALIQAAEIGPSESHMAGDEIGFSLYNDLLKKIDPTRAENAGLRSILSAVPFGGPALAVIDQAAKINNSIRKVAPLAAAMQAKGKPAAAPQAAPQLPAPAAAAPQQQRAPQAPARAPQAQQQVVYVVQPPKAAPWYAPSPGSAYARGLNVRR